MTSHNLVLLLHLLSAGVLIGVAFFSLVFTAKAPVPAEQLKFVDKLRSYGTLAVGALLLSGLFLVWDEPGKLGSWRFWLKMGLILVDGFLAQALIKTKILRAMNGGDQAGLYRLTTISAVIITLVVALGFISATN